MSLRFRIASTSQIVSRMASLHRLRQVNIDFDINGNNVVLHSKILFFLPPHFSLHCLLLASLSSLTPLIGWPCFLTPSSDDFSTTVKATCECMVAAGSFFEIDDGEVRGGLVVRGNFFSFHLYSVVVFSILFSSSTTVKHMAMTKSAMPWLGFPLFLFYFLNAFILRTYVLYCMNYVSLLNYC